METRSPFCGGRTAAALSLAAFACGCSSPPPQQSAEQIEKQCQVWRSYVPARDYMHVLDECSHQLGEAQCKKCLSP